MFDDFRKKIKKRPNQQQSEDRVVKRRRGRSRKPNNEHLHLMMDRSLKNQFAKYVEEKGKGSMSRVVEDMVRQLLENNLANNKRT